MRTYKLTVSTPEGNIFEGDVRRLIVRGLEGDLAVMAGHIPFATVIKPGVYSVEHEDGTLRKGNIGGGILNVSSEGTTLLAGSIEWDKSDKK